MPRSDFRPELIGIMGLMPFHAYDSASRMEMISRQMGQLVVINGSNKRRTQTGMERKYGEQTNSIKIKCNAIVVDIIHKYPKTYGFDDVKSNPVSTIIYENIDETPYRLESIDLLEYYYQHQNYGYRYVQKPICRTLIKGSRIAKGTILADSPNVDEHGNYSYGVGAQMLFASLSGVAEDGGIVREGFLKKLGFKGYGKRVVSWGSMRYPLNMYGSPGNYKPFPNIGDIIRPDGLVCASRQYNELLAPIQMTDEALMDYSPIFDKPVFGEPGARVVDITVYKSNIEKTGLPLGMTDQCEFYYRKHLDYYTDILTLEKQVKRHNNGIDPRTSPQLQNLFVTARAWVDSHGSNEKLRRHSKGVTLTMGKKELDEWRVEITYEYDVHPTNGFKFSGTHGDKAVICEVWPDERMPVNEMGIRADFIMADDANTKRMIPGRLHEQYITSSMQATSIKARNMLYNENRPIEEIFNYITRFYQIVSPQFYDLVMEFTTDKEYHVECVCDDGMYLWLPTTNEVSLADVIEQLKEEYPAPMSKLKYIDAFGKHLETKDEMLIGEIYIILLEKTSRTSTGVSSAKVQHFGVPSKIPKSEKYSSPTRASSIRALGETEGRLLAACCGGELLADILDQTGSIRSHRAICEAILNADEPTRIKKVIDRTKYPLGDSRVLGMVKHLFSCAGFQLVRGNGVTKYERVS